MRRVTSLRNTVLALILATGRSLKLLSVSRSLFACVYTVHAMSAIRLTAPTGLALHVAINAVRNVLDIPRRKHKGAKVRTSRVWIPTKYTRLQASKRLTKLAKDLRPMLDIESFLLLMNLFTLMNNNRLRRFP
jgi:hypothetical protein